jgi:hypothetical protein
MQRLDSKKVSKAEKLQVIQNLISGILDISNYRPPKNYTVLLENDKATVKHYSEGDLELSLEHYELWKQTLGEQDLLFVVNVQDYSAKDAVVIPGDHESEPVILRPDPRFKQWEEVRTYGEEEGQDLRERVKDEPKEQPKRQARKSPKKDLKNDIPAIKLEDDIFPILPNHGKISDYGKTWKLRRN